METELGDILKEIQRRDIANNFDRMKSGTGRSQAFGVIRRWSYRPWLSRNTWMRPELWSLIQAFAARNVSIPWDACTVNSNYLSAPHKDKGNEGNTYIVAFGDYTGGELVINGLEHDIRHKPLHFCGSTELHWTKPWEGNRYSLVFYRVSWPTKFLPRYAVTSIYNSEGTVVSDDYDQSQVILDRRGHVVRVLRAGLPRDWIGRLTTRGQRSRAFPESGDPASHLSSGVLSLAEDTSSQDDELPPPFF